MASKQKLGYKRNSPYKNDPHIRINSNSITMEGVDEPILAVPDTGKPIVAQPGENYYFVGANHVDEYKMKHTYKRGGMEDVLLETHLASLNKKDREGFISQWMGLQPSDQDMLVHELSTQYHQIRNQYKKGGETYSMSDMYQDGGTADGRPFDPRTMFVPKIGNQAIELPAGFNVVDQNLDMVRTEDQVDRPPVRATAPPAPTRQRAAQSSAQTQSSSMPRVSRPENNSGSAWAIRDIKDNYSQYQPIGEPQRWNSSQTSNFRKVPGTNDILYSPNGRAYKRLQNGSYLELRRTPSPAQPTLPGMLNPAFVNPTRIQSPEGMELELSRNGVRNISINDLPRNSAPGVPPVTATLVPSDGVVSTPQNQPSTLRTSSTASVNPIWTNPLNTAYRPYEITDIVNPTNMPSDPNLVMEQVIPLPDHPYRSTRAVPIAMEALNSDFEIPARSERPVENPLPRLVPSPWASNPDVSPNQLVIPNSNPATTPRRTVPSPGQFSAGTYTRTAQPTTENLVSMQAPQDNLVRPRLGIESNPGPIRPSFRTPGQESAQAAEAAYQRITGDPRINLGASTFPFTGQTVSNVPQPAAQVSTAVNRPNLEAGLGPYTPALPPGPDPITGYDSWQDVPNSGLTRAEMMRTATGAFAPLAPAVDLASNMGSLIVGANDINRSFRDWNQRSIDGYNRFVDSFTPDLPIMDATLGVAPNVGNYLSQPYNAPSNEFGDVGTIQNFSPEVQQSILSAGLREFSNNQGYDQNGNVITVDPSTNQLVRADELQARQDSQRVVGGSMQFSPTSNRPIATPDSIINSSSRQYESMTGVPVEYAHLAGVYDKFGLLPEFESQTIVPVDKRYNGNQVVVAANGLAFEVNNGRYKLINDPNFTVTGAEQVAARRRFYNRR